MKKRTRQHPASKALELLAKGHRLNDNTLTPRQQVALRDRLLDTFSLLTFEEQVLMLRHMELLIESRVRDAEAGRDERMLPPGCVYGMIAAVPEAQFMEIEEKIKRGNRHSKGG